MAPQQTSADQTAHRDVQKVADKHQTPQNHDKALQNLYKDANKLRGQDQQKFWDTVATDASKAHLPDLKFDYSADHHVKSVKDAQGKEVYNSEKAAAKPGDKGEKPGYTAGLDKGQGPYQALQKQHPDWSHKQLMEASHQIMKETGRHSFNQGEQFKINENGSVSIRTESKDGNSSKETTYEKGKAVGDKTTNKTADGYESTEHNYKDKTTTQTTKKGDDISSTTTNEKGEVVGTRKENAKTGNWSEETKDGKTEHKQDPNGSYTETFKGKDGVSKSTKTYDATKGTTHTDAVDKDGNRTVRDENSKDGTYKATVTNKDGKVTHTEEKDKDGNTKVRDIDPKTGNWTEKAVDAKTGNITSSKHDGTTGDTDSVTTDKTGKNVISTRHEDKNGNWEENNKKDGTVTKHTVDGKGGYTESVKGKDFSSSTTVDKDGNKHIESEDAKHNKTVRDEHPDKTYSQTVTDAQGNVVEKSQRTWDGSRLNFLNYNQTETIENANGKTTNHYDGSGNLTAGEWQSKKDSSKSSFTYDASTGLKHTDATDKDGNRTVTDQNTKDGSYATSVTNKDGKVTHTEQKDKDGNTTVRDIDPKTGNWTEKSVDAKTGNIKTSKHDNTTGDTDSVTTDKSGKNVLSKRHEDKDGNWKEVNKDGTITEHKLDGKGGYSDTVSRRDGYHSTTTVDKDGNKHFESEDAKHNKTVRDEKPDHTYSQTVTDANGKVIEKAQRSWDGNRFNFLNYNQTETIETPDGKTTNHYDANGTQTSGQWESSKDKSSFGWQINSDGSKTSFSTDANGKRTETVTPSDLPQVVPAL